MSISVQRPFLGQEEVDAVRRVFESGWLGMGEVTRQFEQALQGFLGAPYVVGVGSGTAALHLALAALGLHAGDEVILPSLTFVATAQAVLATGARCVFCDVDEDSLTLDVDDAVHRVTPRTKVLIPVHYGSAVCRMDELLAVARVRGLRVVEDAAHAFGSEARGRRVGSLGDVTCFSFDPVKNVTCGEGGAVATSDEVVARKVARSRMLGINKDGWARLAGGDWGYDVEELGFRYHLGNVQAAIGLEQLKRLEEFRRRKQDIAARYDRAFAGIEGLRIQARHPTESFPFLYVVRVLDGRRAAFMDFLKARDVLTGVHYVPVHRLSLFADAAASLAVTERVAQQIVSLPLHVALSDGDVQRVIDAVQAFFAQGRDRIVSVEARRPGRRRTLHGGGPVRG